MVPDTSDQMPHPPLSFYGIQGEEMKDKNSLSFGNLIEATEVSTYNMYYISYQLKLIKMHAELAYLNHCAVPFLSHATDNYCRCNNT